MAEPSDETTRPTTDQEAPAGQEPTGEKPAGEEPAQAANVFLEPEAPDVPLDPDLPAFDRVQTRDGA